MVVTSGYYLATESLLSVSGPTQSHSRWQLSAELSLSLSLTPIPLDRLTGLECEDDSLEEKFLFTRGPGGSEGPVESGEPGAPDGPIGANGPEVPVGPGGLGVAVYDTF